MRRFFALVLRLAVFTALAVWLADRPGSARIVWHGYVVETSAAVLGLAVLGAGLLFYFVFRLGHILKNGPELWRMGRAIRKLREGQQDVTRGLVAVAGGDAAVAGRFAVSARKKLGVTPATQLLQAQAAQLAGDYGAARLLFRAMADEPDSAVLGYRGLIMEARRTGDWADVRRLADRLHKLKPDMPWLNLVRFELAARREDWEEAGASLARVGAARLVEPSRLARYRAAALIAKAMAESRAGHAGQALQAAEQAARHAPEWVPAAIHLARCQTAAGHARAARRTIEKSWAKTPHPQLAALYCPPNASPIEALRLMERLCKATQDAPESRLVLAEAALAAGVWGEARHHLTALAARGEAFATQAVYRLLAQLERREKKDEQAALRWLTKAADAPADPVWLCRACGGSHRDWTPSCRSCHAFATLDWLAPGVSRTEAPAPLSLTSDWIQ